MLFLILGGLLLKSGVLLMSLRSNPPSLPHHEAAGPLPACSRWLCCPPICQPASARNPERKGAQLTRAKSLKKNSLKCTCSFIIVTHDNDTRLGVPGLNRAKHRHGEPLLCSACPAWFSAWASAPPACWSCFGAPEEWRRWLHSGVGSVHPPPACGVGRGSAPLVKSRATALVLLGLD